MQCTRLKHFRRINANGTLGVCGHMVLAPDFTSIEESNTWCEDLAEQMLNNTWPKECVRCQDMESSGRISIRQHSQRRHDDLIHGHPEYLIIGGTLDSYCNSACMMCNSDLSSRIASLNKEKILNDNYDVLRSLPQDRILQLDINGGEPSYSKNYQRILDDLPKNLSYLRINTNGHRVMPNIQKPLDMGIHVNVTLSLDGTDDIHDYIRWPIKFVDYNRTVNQYIELRNHYDNLTLDFWTTVSSLNLNNLHLILEYAEQKQIGHSYALIEQPDCLSIKNTNWLTKRYTGNEKHVAVLPDNDEELEAYLNHQEQLRKMKRIPELIR